MSRYLRLENGAAVLAGLIAALVLHQITGWWLDSGRGVGVTIAALFAIAFLITIRPIQRRGERGVSLWAGTLVGMTAVLVWNGAGTLWPIVLIIAAIMTAAAVLAGLALATMLT